MRTGNGGSVMRLMAAMVCLLLIGMATGAQTPESGTKPHEVIANGGLLHTLLAAPVIGQPYSAVQVRHTSRKLTDGTTISHEGHHSVARDSEGRIRVERRMARGQNGGPDIMMVFVSDPIAHTFTTWVEGSKDGTKTAMVVKVPAERRRKQPETVPAQATGSSRPKPVVTTEDLGTATIQNLPVTVSKTTTIVPAGRSGNDAPITKTHETWTSPDLKLVMKEQWEDPRSGEMTVELDHFSRAEPESALFHPPAGYVVKDMLQSMKELAQKLSDMQD